jgi:hypothetical protein
MLELEYGKGDAAAVAVYASNRQVEPVLPAFDFRLVADIFIDLKVVARILAKR